MTPSTPPEAAILEALACLESGECVFDSDLCPHQKTMIDSYRAAIAERDLWKAQSEFESTHRENYRKDLMISVKTLASVRRELAKALSLAKRWASDKNLKAAMSRAESAESALAEFKKAYERSRCEVIAFKTERDEARAEVERLKAELEKKS